MVEMEQPIPSLVLRILSLVAVVAVLMEAVLD
jgi:hypothetical protein